MERIQFGIAILVLLLIFTVITGIWMKVANMIGEKLGIGNFFSNLCKERDKYNK
ncbi:MAG: hypothetical protein JJT76_14800 [Clostridiaceae bacterium]|nr:hypothetical protein [Clostridiaceae bacterium]